MKKKVIIIVAVIIVIIIIAGVCIINKNKNKSKEKEKGKTTDEIVSLINEKSNLPIEYMSKYNKEDSRLKEYSLLDNYMSDDYSSDDIFFSFYGYPNDESDFYLGEVSLSTNKFNILGITIGDDYEEAVLKLKDFGFKSDEKSETESMATLTYGDFTIKIEVELDKYAQTGEMVVGSYEIKVDSEYLGNRIY